MELSAWNVCWDRRRTDVSKHGKRCHVWMDCRGFVEQNASLSFAALRSRFFNSDSTRFSCPNLEGSWEMEFVVDFHKLFWINFVPYIFPFDLMATFNRWLWPWTLSPNKVRREQRTYENMISNKIDYMRLMSCMHRMAKMEHHILNTRYFMLSLDNRDVSSEFFFLWLQLGTRTLSKTPRMQRRVGLSDSGGVG